MGATKLGVNVGSSSFLNQSMGMVKSLGQQAISALMPHDFEWYLISFELATADNKTIDYLTFPIQPDSIMKIEQNRNNIKKTMGGVTILSSTALSLGELVLRGSFGRNFKIMIEADLPSVEGVGYAISAGKWSLFDLVSNNSSKNKLSFNFNGLGASVKTGYGVLKILQAMIDKSNGVDERGRPFKLFFYNMALGESYQVVVPPNGVRYSQDLSKNMIWYYDLRFTIVAPLEAVAFGKADSWKAFGVAAAQQAVDITAGAVKDLVDPMLEETLEVRASSFRKAVPEDSNDEASADYSDTEG